jgi:hypothetical protein
VILQLRVGAEVLSYPLSGTSLVGRHWSCGVRVPSPEVPAFWIEVRWTVLGWRWRELVGGGATRGGASAEPGWRAFGAHPVRWGESVALSLLGDAPPEEAVLGLEDGSVIQGTAIDGLLELSEDARWLRVEEGRPARRVADGDVFCLDGCAYRYLAGIPVAPTAREAVQLLHRAVTLDISVAALVATFVRGARELVVTGECVRVLAVYALARGAGEGWLTRDEAYAAWRELGGAAASEAVRLGWERGKLRTQLARQGALGVRDLFETRVVEGVHETRLALPGAVRVA